MARKDDDRRVRRTRQQLMDALLDLIRERGFEALTVQEIIDRANVGRSTFYAHFGGKEDLLVQGLDQFGDAMKDVQRRALRGSGGVPTFAFARELIAHVKEHTDVFRAMVGKRSGAVLQRRFLRNLAELVREEVGVTTGRRGAGPAEAVVQYVATGLYGLLAWWMDGSMRLSVDEMTSLFTRLASASLKAV